MPDRVGAITSWGVVSYLALVSSSCCDGDFPPVSFPPSPSSSVRAHVGCVRCLDPTAGRAAPCTDEDASCLLVFLNSTFFVWDGVGGHDIGMSETARNKSRMLAALLSIVLREEAGGSRERSTSNAYIAAVLVLTSREKHSISKASQQPLRIT